MDVPDIGGLTVNESKDARALSELISNGFVMLSGFRGEHWKKSPEECIVVAGPLTDILKQNTALSKQIKDFAPVITLLFGTVLLCAGPLAVEKEIAKQKKATKTNATIRSSQEQQPEDSGISEAIIREISNTFSDPGYQLYGNQGS